MSPNLGIILSVAAALGIVAAAFYLGAVLSRRGCRLRNASVRALGFSITATSVVVGILLVVIGIIAVTRGSFWRLVFVAMPYAAAAGVLIGGLLLTAAALLYVALRHEAFTAAGYTRLPHSSAIALSMAVLLATSYVAYDRYLGPQWQMWPYRSLSALSDRGQLTLQGWLPRESRFESLISIDPNAVADWRVSFELSSVDTAGTIKIRLQPQGSSSANVKFLRVPFEPSAYTLTQAGELLRVD